MTLHRDRRLKPLVETACGLDAAGTKAPVREAKSPNNAGVRAPHRDSGSTIDWIEEGRKHFLQTKLHPERLAANYPTQDVHSPKDEADFILGFKAARGEWERAGGGLSGISAYVE